MILWTLEGIACDLTKKTHMLNSQYGNMTFLNVLFLSYIYVN